MSGQPRDTQRVSDQSGAVSGLLRAWSHGDLGARDELLTLLYRELRQRAAVYLRRERHDHTLPTALVHEAYLRLVGETRVVWQDRAHFFRAAAQMMRRILVDHARAHRAAKRPGAAFEVTLDDRIASTEPRGVDLLALDRRWTTSRRAIPAWPRSWNFATSAASRSRKWPSLDTAAAAVEQGRAVRCHTGE